MEALTRSIREFGLIDPIIVRREDKVVISGHERLIAARKLGYTTVPVVFVDLSLDQAHLLNIALNKISGNFVECLQGKHIGTFGKVQFSNCKWLDSSSIFHNVNYGSGTEYKITCYNTYNETMEPSNIGSDSQSFSVSH